MGRMKKLFKNLVYVSKHDLKRRKLLEMYYGDIVENILYYIPNASIVRPNVLDADATLDILCNSNKSIARFGDGEICIINGGGIPYQEYDPTLAARMRDMLKNTDENIMIGINHWYFYPEYDANAAPINKDFGLFCMPNCRRNLLKLINFDAQYYDAGFTSLKTEKTAGTDRFFEKIRTIWANRNIVIVDNPQLRGKTTHNLFDNAANITYVDVPNMHSFREYEHVLSALKTFSTDTLIILMAGPLSKVLVGDLSPLGYRALDLGHIGKAYDWYMSNTELSNDNITAFWQPDL